MCGEKCSSTVTATAIEGSPPHVRGKVPLATFFCSLAGITPACAGKRSMIMAEKEYPWDHPRMCGEKHIQPHRGDWAKGSPPHVRGKAHTHRNLPAHRWITPACAGKSLTACPSGGLGWDHPRMCGEKYGCGQIVAVSKGSPPHVRGKAAVAGAQ